MKTPVNGFKQALRERCVQFGLWVGLANAYGAEICAGAGFDWLVLDAEHGPNTVQTLLAQLQAVTPHGTHAVVRATSGDPAHLKQLLDIGAATVLVPMVESAEQARALVRAVRHPPEGIRGVSTVLARAAQWGRYEDYLERANDEVCLVVQIESAAALAHVDSIARVDGVDGLLIGPSDLAATLGHRGRSSHAEVRTAIDRAIREAIAAGKPVGILTTDEKLAREFVAAGCTFVAVGVDTALLARATSDLAAKFVPASGAARPARTSTPRR
jgi:4-hydroxy-2-oxoheptanedioate aldolase